MKNTWASNTPDGFYTVWGFLAQEEPHVLDLLDDPVQSLLNDQDRGMHIADLLGCETCRVPAPKVLQDAGITEVIAMPLAVMLDLYPANP